MTSPQDAYELRIKDIEQRMAESGISDQQLELLREILLKTELQRKQYQNRK